MSKRVTYSYDEFAEKRLSKITSPFEGEKFSDTYGRTVRALIDTKECTVEEAKKWTAETLFQYLKKIDKLR